MMRCRNGMNTIDTVQRTDGNLLVPPIGVFYQVIDLLHVESSDTDGEIICELTI